MKIDVPEKKLSRMLRRDIKRHIKSDEGLQAYASEFELYAMKRSYGVMQRTVAACENLGVQKFGEGDFYTLLEIAERSYPTWDSIADSLKRGEKPKFPKEIIT